MGRVEIAPGGAKEAGATLATIGGCVAYYAALAWIEQAFGLWSTQLLMAGLIVGAIFVAAGAVIMASAGK